MDKVKTGLRWTQGKAHIVLRIYSKNKPVRQVHTGETITHRRQWDAARRMPRDKDQAARVMSWVEKYRKSSSGIPVYRDLAELWDYLIRLRAQTREYAPATIATYSRTANILARYRQEKGAFCLDFDAISIDFFQEFTAFMAASGACEEYRNKTLSHIKDALEAATERGLYAGPLPRPKRSGKNRTPGSRIYLSQHELQAIEGAPLPGGLARVRDAFLISAFTGVRFSDVRRVTAKAVVKWNGRQVIRLTTQKTGAEVAVPANATVIEILKEYPEGIRFSIQYANRALKKVATVAGLPADRAALVTTHTGRRTFATLEYLLAVSNGRSYAPVMRALGHSSEKTFFRYIRLSALENAALMEKTGTGAY